jgi:hypothetical protein
MLSSLTFKPLVSNFDNIIHQSLKIKKIDTSGLKVKDVNIIHNWLSMSKLYIRGLKVNISIFYTIGTSV